MLAKYSTKRKALFANSGKKVIETELETHIRIATKHDHLPVVTGTPGDAVVKPGEGEDSPGVGLVKPGVGEVNPGVGEVKPGLGLVISGVGVVIPGVPVPVVIRGVRVIRGVSVAVAKNKQLYHAGWQNHLERYTVKCK